MTTWRGIAFLWTFASLFFLASGLLMLRAQHWAAGVLFLLIATIGVAVTVWARRRHRETTPPKE